jgi:ribose transport system substrate-binding protein
MEELMRDTPSARLVHLAAVALAGAAALAVLAVAAAAAVPPEVANAVKKYRATPAFVQPGPPIDASKARGKTIFMIPESSSIPFINTIDKSIQKVAKLVGVKTVVYTNQAQPSQWAAGMNQAVAQKPDLIMLQGAPDPRVLQPQLIAAKKAGIPVLVTHFFEESDPMPPNVTALVRVQFNQAARLEADYAIADTGGKANVVIVTSNEVPIAKGMLDAMKQEFAKCGSGCKYTIVNVPIPDWATKIQTEVQSALVKNPDANYVIPFVDGMSQFAAAGITAAGKVGKVKIATFNGTPFALKLIQDGNVVAMDVGENLDWLGWADMDQALRILVGAKPVQSEHTPLRLFDKSNVNQAGTPPKDSTGYGNAYVTKYRALWGLK